MKKIFSMFLMTAGLFLIACSDDFTDWESQQTYLPEDAISIPGFRATALGAVDLNDVEADVPLLTLSEEALPEGFAIQSLRIFVTPANAGEGIVPTEISADANNNFAKADLQQLIELAYGKRPVNRVFHAHVFASAVKDGQAALIDAGVIELNLTPEAPQISENYYIVGGTLDWAGSAASKEQKFSHSDKDVYEDPEFTIVINAGEGDTWFAIGDDEACDAITNDGDWSKLFGTKKGNGNTDLTGSLDRRYNLSDEGSFCVPAGNKKIKVTINMMDYTYVITSVNIAENYYLIGGPGNWDSSKNQKFSHSSRDVFEDPVFTYVFEGTGGEMWFAFGDDEAIDAVGDGVWNKLFGTKGDSKDLSGSFDRRYNLDGDHSFCVDGTARYYRFSVNMAEMTYEITALNFSEYFYEIGNESGWGTSHTLYGANGDGKYQGYYWLDGEFKFKPNADNWDDDLEYVGGSAMEGTLQSTGGPNCPDPGAGFYRIDLDASLLLYKLTKIETIGIIGGFNGWSGDVDMAYNTAEGCWEATATLSEDTELKFRANHDWGINWGGDVNDLVADGANLKVSAGTYQFKLYISYQGNNRVSITKK